MPLSKRDNETLDALAEVNSGRAVKGGRVLEWIASWGSAEESSHHPFYQDPPSPPFEPAGR